MVSQSRSTRREPPGCYRTRICESWLIWALERKKLNIGSATSVTNMLRSMEIIGHRFDVHDRTSNTESLQEKLQNDYNSQVYLEKDELPSHMVESSEPPQSIHQEICCRQHRPLTTPTRASR